MALRDKTDTKEISMKLVLPLENFYANVPVDEDGNARLTDVLSAFKINVEGTGLPEVQNFGMLTKTQTTITFQWNPYIDQTADGFEVYLSSLGPTDQGSLVNTGGLIPISDTTYQITGLTSSTTYWIKIRAKKGTSYSGFNPVYQETTLNIIQLAQPTNFNVVPSNQKNTLSWDAVANAEDYDVRYNTVNDFNSSILLTNTNQLTYPHTGLTNGTPYHYYIVARASGYDDSSPAYKSGTPIASGTATRLGIHTSDNELAIWIQRWTDAAYANEVSRINQIADSFFINPAKVYYLTSGQAPFTFSWGIVSAAFRGLVANSTSDRQAVRDYLIYQANNGADLSAYSLEGPFQHSKFFDRLIMAYDFVNIADAYYSTSILSVGDKTAIESYISTVANQLKDDVHNVLVTLFPNRLSEDWSVKQGVAGSPAKSGQLTHINVDGSNGYDIYYVHKYYNNRKSSMMSVVGMAGVLLNDATLINHAKVYWKEMLMFGVYPNGMFSDYERNGDGTPMQGWNYSCIICEFLVRLADALERTGDDSLFTFSTSDGITTTIGGPKTLELVLTNHHTLGQTYANPLGSSANKFYATVTINNRIDAIYDPSSFMIVNDAWMMMASRYYNTAFLNSVYGNILQRIANHPGYNIASNGPIWYYWGGGGPSMPHYGFTHGNWQGIVIEQPDSDILNGVQNVWLLNETGIQVSDLRADQVGGISLTPSGTLIAQEPGLNGGSYTNDGSQVELRAGNNSALSFAGEDFAFTFRFYIHNTGAFQYLIVKDIAGDESYYLAYDQTTGKLRFRVYDESTFVQLASTVAVVQDTWHFGYVHYEVSTKEVALSVDLETLVTDNLAGTFNANTTSPFTVGGRGASSPRLSGRLDDIIRWNRKLTTEEITQAKNTFYPFN